MHDIPKNVQPMFPLIYQSIENKSLFFYYYYKKLVPLIKREVSLIKNVNSVKDEAGINEKKTQQQYSK